MRVTGERGVAVAQGVAAYGDVILLRRIANAVKSCEEPRTLNGPPLTQASWTGYSPAVTLPLELAAAPDFSENPCILSMYGYAAR